MSCEVDGLYDADEAASFRDISDEAAKYIKKHRKSGSFALALRLDRAEFDEYLQIAGYSLSNTSARDGCIMYCLEKRIYDIDEVNALLFAVGIEPLSRE